MLLNDFKHWTTTYKEPLTVMAGMKDGKSKTYRILCPNCDSPDTTESTTDAPILLGYCQNCKVEFTEYFMRVKEIK